MKSKVFLVKTLSAVVALSVIAACAPKSRKLEGIPKVAVTTPDNTNSKTTDLQKKTEEQKKTEVQKPAAGADANGGATTEGQKEDQKQEQAQEEQAVQKTLAEKVVGLGSESKEGEFLNALVRTSADEGIVIRKNLKDNTVKVTTLKGDVEAALEGATADLKEENGVVTLVLKVGEEEVTLSEEVSLNKATVSKVTAVEEANRAATEVKVAATAEVRVNTARVNGKILTQSVLLSDALQVVGANEDGTEAVLTQEDVTLKLEATTADGVTFSVVEPSESAKSIKSVVLTDANCLKITLNNGTVIEIAIEKAIQLK